MPTLRGSFSVVLSLLVSFWSLPARADGQPIITTNAYRVSVQGNTVIVCLHSEENVGGGAMTPERGSILLRYNRSKKQLVALGLDNASSTAAAYELGLCERNWAGSCYCMKDECVPPGAYRYGWSPFPGFCGQIFGEATVTDSVPDSCIATAPPVPLKANPPLRWDGSINDYGQPCELPGGCAIARGSSAVVLLIQAACFSLGVLLARRRRRS